VEDNPIRQEEWDRLERDLPSAANEFSHVNHFPNQVNMRMQHQQPIMDDASMIDYDSDDTGVLVQALSARRALSLTLRNTGRRTLATLETAARARAGAGRIVSPADADPAEEEVVEIPPPLLPNQPNHQARRPRVRRNGVRFDTG
jgi:hypothetical protein